MVELAIGKEGFAFESKGFRNHKSGSLGLPLVNQAVTKVRRIEPKWTQIADWVLVDRLYLVEKCGGDDETLTRDLGASEAGRY